VTAVTVGARELRIGAFELERGKIGCGERRLRAAKRGGAEESIIQWASVGTTEQIAEKCLYGTRD
jgi:hypothetical protein